MPSITTLASGVCLPGRVRKGDWSEDLGASGKVSVAPADRYEVTGAGTVYTPENDMSPGKFTRKSSRRIGTFAGWSWTHDPDKLTTIQNVWYQAGRETADGYVTGHLMKVLDKVEWESVHISGHYRDPTGKKGESPWKLTKGKLDASDRLALPLTREHLAARYHLKGGSVSPNGLWKLKADVDSALVLVFAYELQFKTTADRRTGQCDLVPIAAVDYKSESFMPVAHVTLAGSDADEDYVTSQASPSGATTAAGTEKTAEITLANPRVLVVLSWTTCKPRKDFEPGEIVEMVRCHPHAQVLCSVPLHEVDVRTRVKRPAESSMYEPPSDERKESASKDLHAVFFTDTNESRGGAYWSAGMMPPVPIWGNFFDYFQDFKTLSPAGRTYHVVKASASKRTITDAIGIQPTFFVGGGWDGIDEKDIVKVARQGAYDNIHVAPKMTAPEALIREYEVLRPLLTQVAMAPFCACDCLHIHWRWSVEYTKTHNLGWGDNGPHTEAGAPMVPPSQDVYIDLKSKADFVYRAVSHRPRAMEWQMFFHHGMAQAVGLGDFDAMMATFGPTIYRKVKGEGWLSLPDTAGADASAYFWSMLYYSFRYFTPWGRIFKLEEVLERLVIRDLAKLEDG